MHFDEPGIGSVEIGHRDAETAESGIGDALAWLALRARYLPFEQIEDDALVAVVAVQDPRVPLHLLEPEGGAGLRGIGLRPRAFAQADAVAVEGERAFEIRAVDVDVVDAVRPNSVLPHPAIIARSATGEVGQTSPAVPPLHRLVAKPPEPCRSWIGTDCDSCIDAAPRVAQ